VPKPVKHAATAPTPSPTPGSAFADVSAC
jgi:hypothetical protein